MAGEVYGVDLVLLVFIVVMAVGIYFIPTIVAMSRKHHQAGAVFAINLLLGWTLIGWAVALAMSMSAHRQPPVIINQYSPTGPPQAAGPPPGWYPDPSIGGQVRYWTGAGWGPAAPEARTAAAAKKSEFSKNSETRLSPQDEPARAAVVDTSPQEEFSYGTADWPVAAKAMLRGALGANGVKYKWQGDALVVDSQAQSTVDRLIRKYIPNQAAADPVPPLP